MRYLFRKHKYFFCILLFYSCNVQSSTKIQKTNKSQSKGSEGFKNTDVKSGKKNMVDIDVRSMGNFVTKRKHLFIPVEKSYIFTIHIKNNGEELTGKEKLTIKTYRNKGHCTDVKEGEVIIEKNLEEISQLEVLKKEGEVGKFPIKTGEIVPFPINITVTESTLKDIKNGGSVVMTTELTKNGTLLGKSPPISFNHKLLSDLTERTKHHIALGIDSVIFVGFIALLITI